MLLYSKFYVENQMWYIKRYAKKKYLSWVYGVDRKNLSLEITDRHHSASLVMPISDPRNRFFYPRHTHMKDYL